MVGGEDGLNIYMNILYIYMNIYIHIYIQGASVVGGEDCVPPELPLQGTHFTCLTSTKVQKYKY